MSGNVISVIVPIYNSEDYLDECLESLCSQSYRQLQIILINDGSTDSSLDIAKRFAAQDARILLIDQPNAGVGAARQAGLERVTGDYIIHCDSDDQVPKDAYATLASAIIESGAEIAIGNYTVEYPDKKIPFVYAPSDSSVLLRKILSGEFRGSLWNKLIKKDLYRDLGFEEGIDFMEDKLILVQMLARKEVRVTYVNSSVYLYRQVPGSYTNSMSQRSVLIANLVDGKIFDLVESRFDVSFLAHIKNKRRVSSLLNSSLSQRNTFKEANPYLMSDRRISLHHRLLLWCDIVGFSEFISFYKWLTKKLRFR